jgi:hypothetical protein
MPSNQALALQRTVEPGDYEDSPAAKRIKSYLGSVESGECRSLLGERLAGHKAIPSHVVAIATDLQ